jgi:hypothetical protein
VLGEYEDSSSQILAIQMGLQEEEEEEEEKE